MKRPCTALPLALSLTSVACGPEQIGGDAGGVDRPVAEGRYGLVVLTHQFSEPGVEVSGQLMVYRDRSRTAALHALALPEQAWLTGALPEPQRCVAVSAGAERAPAGASVDLLSAGELVVHPPAPLDTPTWLPPRDFPPITFAVSGVVYDAVAPQQLPYLAGGTYLVQATGDEVGPFTGEVEAPGPTWLREHSFDADGLHLRLGGEGPAVVVVSRDAGSMTTGVQCHLEGPDEVLVPAEALAAFGAGDAQLVVARITHGSLSIDGLDEAELLFVSRDASDIHIPDRYAFEGAGR